MIKGRGWMTLAVTVILAASGAVMGAVDLLQRGTITLSELDGGASLLCIAAVVRRARVERWRHRYGSRSGG